MIPHIPLLDGHGEISLAGLGHQDPEQIICSAKEGWFHLASSFLELDQLCNSDVLCCDKLMSFAPIFQRTRRKCTCSSSLSFGEQTSTIWRPHPCTMRCEPSESQLNRYTACVSLHKNVTLNGRSCQEEPLSLRISSEPGAVDQKRTVLVPLGQSEWKVHSTRH